MQNLTNSTHHVADSASYQEFPWIAAILIGVVVLIFDGLTAWLINHYVESSNQDFVSVDTHPESNPQFQQWAEFINAPSERLETLQIDNVSQTPGYELAQNVNSSQRLEGVPLSDDKRGELRITLE